MFTVTQLVGIAALASTALFPTSVHADVVPTAPGPGDSFNVRLLENVPERGCTVQWNLDTTGTWKDFTIQLMTGSNFQMTPLATVASGLDGTTGTGKLEWTCPQVTPNSAIYFYQFTQTGANTSWTTRFTIADANGQSTAPPETTMVNGVAVGYGTGRLSGASVSLSSNAAAGSASASSGTGAAGSSAASAASSTAASATASGMTTVTTTSSTAVETAASSSSSSDASSSSSSSSSASSASQATKAAQSSTPNSGASSATTSIISGSVVLAVAFLAFLV
ncbi:uncharacterized protein JCM15063_003704 [Sporobolomyces koalae]|uniref:uncharacterized protein n=1 Tax=Sporobolomyces koalae TaxID=500713 RepID=UPI00317C546C